MQFRTGLGYDVHPLVDHRPLVLGGVEIPFEKGLLGHSDADALLHAICDALLGALALGDLGKYFSDTDPAWKNASSLRILAEVYAKITALGFRLENLDSTILAERPKLAAFIFEIRKNIARVLNVEIDRISVKATRGEKLGFVGREEGIAVQAIVLLSKNK